MADQAQKIKWSPPSLPLHRVLSPPPAPKPVTSDRPPLDRPLPAQPKPVFPAVVLGEPEKARLKIRPPEHEAQLALPAPSNPGEAFWEGFIASLRSAVEIVETSAEGLNLAAKKVSQRLGVPLDLATEAVLREVRDLKQVFRERYGPPKGFLSTLSYGAGRAVGDLPVFMVINRVVRRPTLSFAILGAAREAKGGVVDAARGAAVGAVMGEALHRVGQIQNFYWRLAAGAASGAVPAMLAGEGAAETAAHATLGALVSVFPEPSGTYRKAPKEPKYEFVKPPKDLSTTAEVFGSPSIQWAEIVPWLKDMLYGVRLAARQATRQRNDWVTRINKAVAYFRLPTKARREAWQRVVSYLDDPRYNLQNLPQDAPRVVEAYRELRLVLDEIGTALRRYLESRGIPIDSDWWEEAYFPHIWRGLYAVYVKHGDREYPLPIGWLHENLRSAERAIETFAKMTGIAPSPDNYVVIQKNPFALSTRHPAEMRMPHAELRAGMKLEGWDDTPNALVEYANRVAHFIHINRIVKEELEPALFRLRTQHPERTALIRAVERYVNRLQGTTPDYMAWLYRGAQSLGMTPETVDRMLGAARAVEALLKLGFNVASGVANLSQIALTAFPVLGGRWTGRGILGAIEYARTGKYRNLINELALLDMDTKAEQMSTMEALLYNLPWSARDIPAWSLNVMVGSSLAFFKFAEATNRIVTAIGAYERARSLGMNHKQAEAMAEQIVVRTQFEYGLTDAITLMNMPLTQLLFQFRSFMIKMLEFMFGLVRPGKHTTRFDEPRKELGRFLAAVLLTAGPSGFPGAEIVDQLVDWTGGPSLLDEIKRFFPRASRGVPGMLGIDITRTVGFGDWFSLRAMTRPDVANLFGPLPQEILMAIRVLNAYAQTPGREAADLASRTLRQLSPFGRRLWEVFIDAGRSEGSIRDYRGRPIIEDMTLLQRVLYGVIGLTPIRLAEQRSLYVDLQNRIAREKSLRSGYLDAIAEAFVEGDMVVASRLMADAASLGVVFEQRVIEDAIRRRMVPRALYTLNKYQNLLTRGGRDPEEYILLLREAMEKEED